MLLPKSNARRFAAALVLLHACALFARGQADDEIERQRLFAPWSNVAFDVELKGLAVRLWDYSEEAQKRAPGRPLREFFGMFTPVKGSGVPLGFMRIRLEPVSEGVTAEALRERAAEFYPKSQYVTRDTLRRDEYRQMPLLKFTVIGPSPQEGTFLGYYNLIGKPSTYQVLEAYMVRDGTALMFRYSAASSIKEADELLVRRVLDSVKFVDAAAPSSGYDYYLLGGELYRRKEHGAAVAALDKALDLERRQRTLTQPQWRQLVMTLANALGATDDVARARDVLEYGAAAEPTYPFFHHGLSRLYSYLGDLDRVLAALEKTYQHLPKDKGFMGFLRGIPDPLYDPAFQKYKDDPKFRDAVKALKKKHQR